MAEPTRNWLYEERQAFIVLRKARPLETGAKPKHRVRCFGFQQEVLWT